MMMEMTQTTTYLLNAQNFLVLHRQIGSQFLPLHHLVLRLFLHRSHHRKRH